MDQSAGHSASRGLTDDHDRLLSADQALADLQIRCGGSLPGTVAIPELRRFVQQSREMKLRLAREFSAFDGSDIVTGFTRIEPLPMAQGGGCEVLIDNWRIRPQAEADEHQIAMRSDVIDRASAEISLRLSADQRVQFVSDMASDATELSNAIQTQPEELWTDYLELKDVAYQQPLHWRLLDGARCKVPGSSRDWRVRLFPGGEQDGQPSWFELLLIATRTIGAADTAEETDRVEASYQSNTRLIGSALTPALRQPVARIIANAETIKSRLAGPLRAEYSEYAGNIASAGQHLTAMLEDLADLEVVEAEGFSTIREQVELGDAARRAAGILGVRARERDITLVVPEEGDEALAIAEFRRVLQILINLIGNALAYSPSGSTVTVSLAKRKSDPVAIVVKDEGPGVTAAQADRIFEKFERLGRDDDTGSGLGLYISRRLALAMDGDLKLDSKADEGARFKLLLPAANPKKKKG